MILSVSLNTENDAFQPPRNEVARILAALAARITNGETSGSLKDLNGNTCGAFAIQ